MMDDGSCEYTSCADDCGVPNGDNSSCTGCTNSEATNYCDDCTIDDGSCEIPGCMDSGASNYNSEANYDDGSCTYTQVISLSLSLIIYLLFHYLILS